MSAITLSTGVTLLSEQVTWAEYLPYGSFLNTAFVNGVPGRREQDFLYIRTKNGSTCVRGNRADYDVAALEELGVRVYRPPNLDTLDRLSRFSSSVC
jgi:hypothetical protein